MAGIDRKNAAIDCHAVMLNINYGQNRELMKKCRKLEEYSIFIGKVRENTGRKMSIREAIYRAVENCIKEGIKMLALLVEYLQRDGRQQDLKLLSDEKVRNNLFREYHLEE